MSTTLIPLSKLEISPVNARKTYSKGGIEEMQASILAHGLMQNLVVTEASKGKFHVAAGGRRLTALKALQKDGQLPKDHEVACQLTDDDKAAEISLAENIVREAMHPVDEYEAFAKLIDAGATAEQVALRFGKTEKHVLQRMKLARVAPVVIKAYRDEELSLESLMAYTITDDHKRQAKAFKELQGWQSDNPHQIRERLTDKMVQADDRLAKFVGVDKYQQAGGTLKTDLFQDDVYLENSDLLQTLANEKLQAAIEVLKAEGWSWVDSEESGLEYRCKRLAPTPTDAPPALLKERGKLQAKVDQLDQKYQSTDDEDEEEKLLEAKDKLEAELETVEEKLEAYKIYTPEQMAISGCSVSIDHDGAFDVTKGLVKPEDQKRSSQIEDGDEGLKSKEKVKPTMSDSLCRDLESYRLQVAQVEIAMCPAVAFDLMAFTIAFKCLSHQSLHTGPAISFTPQYPTHAVGQEKTSASQIFADLKAGLPTKWLEEETESAQFAAFRELHRDDKDLILAYCTALALQPQLQKAGFYEDALALTGGSVADYWRPTDANYLSRINKEQLLAIGRSVAVSGDSWVSDRKNAKKGALVAELHGMFAESSKPDGRDAITEWLPEAMEFAKPAKKPAKTKKKAA